MNVSKIEELLEMLVNQNSTVIEKLENIQSELRDINSELNWVGDTAFAKQVVDSLNYLGSSIDSVESSISSVEVAVSSVESAINLIQG